MEESEQDRLRRCLDEALAAADAAGDTLIAAKLADCLWLLDRESAASLGRYSVASIARAAASGSSACGDRATDDEDRGAGVERRARGDHALLVADVAVGGADAGDDEEPFGQAALGGARPPRPSRRCRRPPPRARGRPGGRPGRARCRLRRSRRDRRRRGWSASSPRRPSCRAGRRPWHPPASRDRRWHGRSGSRARAGRAPAPPWRRCWGCRGA